MIRVGRRIYSGSSYQDPTFPGFTPILCLTPSSPYGSLSPYVLKSEEGYFLENVWQFSKVYETVPRSRQTYSRYDPTVIWEYPTEIHVKDDRVLPSYWRWRQKGMRAPYPIRYPVGYQHRGKCLYSLFEVDTNTYLELDYIEARKAIYLPEYLKSVRKAPQFRELEERLEQGENLLIIEVDGPHQESLDYYRETYGVRQDFIQDNTVLASRENLEILLEDPKHPFGHGYCLAWKLLGYVPDMIP